MTAQSSDVFNYKKHSYELSAIENPDKFFDFSALGFNNPSVFSTDCYRGYIATFHINKEGKLALQHLDTSDSNLIVYMSVGEAEKQKIKDRIPRVNAKYPIFVHSSESPYSKVDPKGRCSIYKDKDGNRKLRGYIHHSNAFYQDIDLLLDYTGSIIICAGFIFSLYVHMGFHEPFKYKRVIKLDFNRGTLTDETDLSAKASLWRKSIDYDHYPYKDDETGLGMVKWINETFQRDSDRFWEFAKKP
ncbi:MAG: hypothetical protein ACOYJD_09535 [Christensenellales bacterium]|jgi:hypothetical protein